MSHRCRENPAKPQAAFRRGLTLIEMVIAIAILAMVVAALGTVANAVHGTFEYTEGRGLATQHARVVLDRIVATARGATANAQFPGFIVVSDTVGSYQYPETLVVWRPTGSPANPAGLPQFNELVIYCPSPASPNQLLEITLPGNTATVPAVSDQASWSSQIASIKKNLPSTAVVLTDLVRSCPLSASSSNWRGAVRFQARLLPSDAAWSQYQAGTLTWKQLAWAQGICGSTTGLRQVWLRMEIQFMPGAGILGENVAAQKPIAYFGSTAFYYEMNR
jgi:prepilin-type N-terminal cleavage/methylation domain-containing protein